jgi:predicted lysophospholipase L1 biosynthesis ABC-type transport system permease subunit
MKQQENYQKDIESIRQLMERSVKFLSLSGLSGVLAGVYALAGAAVAYTILYQQQKTPFDFHDAQTKATMVMSRLMQVAIIVLIASLVTGYVLALRKSRKLGTQLWNATSKRLLINLAVPLVTGGVFILLSLSKGYYGVVAPGMLIFYGLALINASSNLFDEMRYLGYTEIVLGLAAAAFIGYGLLFWALGFGVLHVIYGVMMYKKYDS